MKKTAFGKPLIIDTNKIQVLERFENFDELTIQNLVFQNPECLPISDIDESFNPLFGYSVSICASDFGVIVLAISLYANCVLQINVYLCKDILHMYYEKA